MGQHRHWADCRVGRLWAVGCRLGSGWSPEATSTSLLMANSSTWSAISSFLHILRFFSFSCTSADCYTQVAWHDPDLSCNFSLKKIGSNPNFSWLENGLGFTLTLDGHLLRMTRMTRPPFAIWKIFVDTALSPKPLEFGHQTERASNRLASRRMDQSILWVFCTLAEGPLTHSLQHLGDYVTHWCVLSAAGMSTHKWASANSQTERYIWEGLTLFLLSRIDGQHCNLFQSFSVHHKMVIWILVNRVSLRSSKIHQDAEWAWIEWWALLSDCWPWPRALGQSVSQWSTTCMENNQQNEHSVAIFGEDCCCLLFPLASLSFKL